MNTVYDESKKYKVIYHGDEAEIKEYVGDDVDVIIPETINGKSVTSIGPWAFSKWEVFYESEPACLNKLKSVEIPCSVKSIGLSAFAFCVNLAVVKLSKGLIKIDDHSFFSCSGLTDIDLPDTLTEIGSSAFSGCVGLTQIIIPDSVIYIDEWAFSDEEDYSDRLTIYCKSESRPQWYNEDWEKLSIKVKWGSNI